MHTTFSILITTKNRVAELGVTLKSIAFLIERNDVECIVWDDGSNDGTYAYVKTEFPEIRLYSNERSKGLIYSRNRLLEKAKGKYAISLDDDAHFLTDNVLQHIGAYFEAHDNVGLLTFRVFWGIIPPKSYKETEPAHIVSGFVGCGHVWHIEDWKAIPNYPEWFLFYGEEQFAALQLFKKKKAILYTPEVLVHHRVDMTARKVHKDYLQRQRRSLRSGWYLYFLCYPKRIMFKKFLSSLWSQLKRKTLKGNISATKAILLALFDVVFHLPYFFTNKYRLTYPEYLKYNKVPKEVIYWFPK